MVNHWTENYSLEANEEIIEMLDLAKDMNTAIMIHMFEKVEENVTMIRREMKVFKISDPNGISRNGKYNIQNAKTHGMVLKSD